MTTQSNEGNPQEIGDEVANSSSMTEGQPSQNELLSQIAELTKRLEAQNGEIRALKSGKDKAVGRLEDAVSPLLEKLGKYLDVDQEKVADAQRRMLLDDLVAERYGQRQSAPATSGKVAQAPTVSVDVQGIASKYGLDPNDAAVASALAEYPTDPKELEIRLANIALGKARQTLPTAAQSPAPAVKPPAPAGEEELRTKYVEEMLAHQGDPRAIRDVQAKYKKLGVPIDQIGFR